MSTDTDHLPIVDTESAPFWEGLAEGKFLLKWCLECGLAHFYPREFCPHCWGATEWREASGHATVHATTTVRQMGFEPFRSNLPYNLAIVELAEGPKMLTSVVGCDPDDVHIGLAVEFVAEQDGDVWVPHFRPAQAE